MKFEDPIQFNLKKKTGNIEVSYENLMEISQGGPEIGDLLVNGELIKGHRFGGPCLVGVDYVVAPIYVRKFLGSGFKLSKIDIDSLKVTLYGKYKELIYLDKLEGGKVYFFEDLNKTVLRSYSLD